MKVIFLDIDGVLNVEVYLTALFDISKKYNLKFNDIIHDQHGDLFCPLATRMLGWIIEDSGAKIVISSTWRFNGLEAMKQMWVDRDLPGEVIDITPSYFHIFGDSDLSFYDKKERGHEIQNYLDNHPEITSYVILDDDNDMLDSQQNNFIETHEMYGITREDAVKAIRILNNEY